MARKAVVAVNNNNIICICTPQHGCVVLYDIIIDTATNLPFEMRFFPFWFRVTNEFCGGRYFVFETRTRLCETSNETVHCVT